MSKHFQISEEMQAKYPELITLILESESMADWEKKYWFDIMPSMTDTQIHILLNILDTDKKKKNILKKMNIL